MTAWAWIKSKAGWILAILGGLVALLITRNMSRSEIKSALALRRLQDAASSHDAAQKKANELKQRTDALAEALLAEELALAAEKKTADAMDPSSVVADLKRRGLLR